MNMRKRPEAKGEAHGKLILVGEHIVVYNKPAIALPIPLMIRASIKEHPGEVSISSNIYTGNLNGMQGRLLGLYKCINEAFWRCNKPVEGLHIDITSELPDGRGLGSSAAAATAIVRGIYDFFQRSLSEEELYSLVELAETYAHGKPSGIDMMTVSRDGPIIFQKSIGALPLIAPCALYFVVADTGIVGDTKKAVNHVKNIKAQRPFAIDSIINQIEDIVIKAKEAVLRGDLILLGDLLYKNHEELKKLEVSHPKLDHLVEIAMNTVALGAKLTGGGMGGCIMALTKDMNDAGIVSRELIREGAKEVWYFSTASKERYRLSSELNEG